MLIGYARVSTTEQNTALQIAALAHVGVSVYFEDQRSGVKRRPELDRLLNLVRDGDTLVVYKLDRLARSLRDLLRIADALTAKGAGLRSLTEHIETTTPAGRMMFHMLGVMAEFERSVILERCEAGRVAAKARGAVFGRARTFSYEDALRMRNAGATFDEIAKFCNVSQSAAIHALRRVRLGKTTAKDPRANPPQADRSLALQTEAA